MKLTKRTIQEAIDKKSIKPVNWDDELKGFGLKATPKGRYSFFLYYRTADHTQRRPNIGSYPAMTPEQARNIAKDWLAEARAGRDPSGERQRLRALRGTGTVSDLFEDYRKAKGKLRSIREVERLFRHDILPVIGQTRAESVTRADVTRMLDRISKRSLSLAHAVRRQLSAFYSWALPRLPDNAVNPVKSAARLQPLSKRERVLSEGEMRQLWRILQTEKDPWRSALQLLILTGQRREEVLQADWIEFDMDKRMWTIPAERSKNKKVHLVPLSPAVVAILEAMLVDNERKGRLFKMGTGPASRAAKRIRDAMGEGVKPWRWHDIRRTVATGMQRLGVRLEVTEAVLNHVSGSQAGIVGVYQQHDWAAEKRGALEAWALELARIAADRATGSNVVQLKVQS